MIVSIHALLRGQTPLCSGQGVTVRVSIHALLRGQTKAWSPCRLPLISFNSCPLARADCCTRNPCRRTPCFNSCPLARADSQQAAMPPRQPVFQFMPSCEGRLGFEEVNAETGEFQFMPSCEGRPPDFFVFRVPFLFQFMPSCEGRPLQASQYFRLISFNSCPLARADTSSSPFSFVSYPVSIHALLRGQTFD